MSRKFPQALFALIFALWVISVPTHSFAATSGGSCPTGSNYLSLSSPQNGNGQGSVTLASLGVSKCFFVSAAGSDSNAGTDEGHPWLHAPGMPSCSGVCASTSISAGTGIILRGGDTWHKSSGNPAMGGTWSFPYSGSGISSPIYIGIDYGWYSGGAFSRPAISEDNPISNALVKSCSYNDDGANAMKISGYVIADGLEFFGDCDAGSGTGQVLNNGSNTVVERVYVHGWTLASSASDDSKIMIGNGNGGVADDTDRILYAVVDGSDSTYGNACTTPTCVANWGGNTGSGGTGWGMSSCWDVEYSIIRHTSQGLLCGDANIIHDNLFEYIFNANYGRHSNVFEIITPGSGNLCTNLVAYNNITRNWDTGVGWWPQCHNYYIFNNVWANSGHFAPDPNSLMISPPGTSGSSVVKAFMYNNVFQASQTQAGPANAQTPALASGSTITFGNNQIMDFTSVSKFFNCSSGDSCSLDDTGGEVFQTTAAANGQGYVLSNDYAPVSPSGATVGAGKDDGSFCNSVPDTTGSAACASGTSGGVMEQSGWGGMVSTYSANPVVARSNTWDAGAFQFGLAPPTGLSAVVQ
jgi:hypothetical protein